MSKEHKCLSCGRKVNKNSRGNYPLWCKKCKVTKMEQLNSIVNEVMSK